MLSVLSVLPNGMLSLRDLLMLALHCFVSVSLTHASRGHGFLSALLMCPMCLEVPGTYRALKKHSLSKIGS